MNNETWFKKKIGTLAVVFLVVLFFNLNKSGSYEAETDILLLPKNETVSRSLDSIMENFKEVLSSLAFNDRLSDGSEALAPGVELPNAKRKEFWNSKLSVERVGGSGVIRIKNFDADGVLAQELNNDTVDSLIAIAGNYYNIKTELEIRIIDGPIVKKTLSQNLPLAVGESVMWSLVIYVVLFFIFPFIFIKKETEMREIPGRDFSRNIPSLKKPIPTILPEEENYFATKNFFESVPKAEKVKEALPQKNNFSFPSFPSFGKKAPTPANLPVSEEEVPDIFRQKEPLTEIKEEAPKPTESANVVEEENVSREATPEEVKARLNRLLGGGK